MPHAPHSSSAFSIQRSLFVARPGRLFRNLGDFRFEEASDAVGLAARADSFQAIFTDFDGDRRPDLYLAGAVRARSAAAAKP